MAYNLLEDKKSILELLNNNKSFVLYFFADWCGPCQKMFSVFEEISSMEKYYKVVFFKVNVDHMAELAADYKVASIPTLVLFKDGKYTGRKIPGLQQKENLITQFDEYFL